MKTAKQIFGLIQGVWRIQRTIVHKMPPDSYKGSGFAVFSSIDDTILLYHERVKLTNLQTQAEIFGHQKYKYTYAPEKDVITKHFEDNRLFYQMILKDDIASGDHLCIQDNYRAIYSFESDEKFSLHYKVKGPQKNYTIFTEYTKLEEPEVLALGLVVNNGELGDIIMTQKKKLLF